MSVSVSISVKTSPHSAGETQQPPDTPAKKTPSAGTVISVVIGLALFLAVKWVKNPSYLAIVHDRFAPVSNQSAVSTTPAKPPEIDYCRMHSDIYLRLQIEGNSVAQDLWKPGVKVKMVPNLQYFWFLDSGPMAQPKSQPAEVPRVYYKYNVTQGTARGTKQWNVVLEPSSSNAGGQSCAIVDIVKGT